MMRAILEPETIYPVGTKYMTRGRHAYECTVVDCLRTYNLKGELIRLRYVATHDLAGQVIHDYDVVATTIAMGLGR